MCCTDGVTVLPTFMPVATQAAIKGLTPQQVEALGINLILNNTYHLNLRPGIGVLKEAGGAHKFQNWRHNLLTVSHPTYSYVMIGLPSRETNYCIFVMVVTSSDHRIAEGSSSFR